MILDGHDRPTILDDLAIMVINNHIINSEGIVSSTFLLSLGLAPGALAQNLVQVQRHRLVGNQTLHLGLQGGRQHAHQGLGGKPVLGALLVVTLGQVLE